MKKTIIVFLLFVCGTLFANDYRWDLANALSRNDYAAVETIVNQNINSLSAQERRVVLNLVLTYSHGETTLRTLQLLQRHNVLPVAFDLYTAINRNQPNDVVFFIMNHGVTANGEILLLAMEKRRLDLARQFIQAGADVNYQYPLSRNDSDGMTSLLYAARYNNLELVQMLVEHGANINARNREGSTALSIAQANGSEPISNFLLGRGASLTGASPTQPNQPGQSGGGIAGLMDNAVTTEFQPGNYRLAGGNRDLRFSGTANSGTIGFVMNNRTYQGAYQVSGGNMTLIMEGRTFVYRLESNTSFAGNGEVWARIGN